MGEKFAANPVTGTGSMSVPIATSPGRSGFGPQLSLSYDSGAGNGPFGFGWSLSLPAITRKTDKGLPKYKDETDSDVFVLSGSEDLVHTLTLNAAGKWEPEVIPDRTVDGRVYHIRRYRPRIEGLFARIERWTNKSDPTDVFWRSISKDNITAWYGKTRESRIFDSSDASRIFSCLICQSYDDKGNAILYEYAAENDSQVDRGQVNEAQRTRAAQRYLKRIKYGNRSPNRNLGDWDATDPALFTQPDDWMFEVVFDYNEKHCEELPLDPAIPEAEQHRFVRASAAPRLPWNAPERQWATRPDPFSTYRAGFEVRTYRLCQRVLMFHHFSGEAEVEANCLVRSTDFTYEFEDNPGNARVPIYSFLTSVTQSGYVRREDQYLKRSLPPVEFTYSKPEVQDRVEEVDPESVENLPIGLDGMTYQWTDLHGEGIPGILSEQAGAWFYKRNWSPIPVKQSDGREVVKAKFSALETVALKPNATLSNGAQFMDLAGDGQPDLVMLDGPLPGLYEHDFEEGWESFRPFTSRLNRNMQDPNLKFLDLDGDGHADVLITEDNAFVWHPSLAEEGFGPAQRVAQALDEEKGPRIVFADGTQSIYLADLSGDGLTDIVRIRNGEVCYWPNLGYGRFGAKVTMDNAPWFDSPDLFDQKRIRLADIDGSGTTDIIYLHCDGVCLYFNQSGNSWSQPKRLNVFPRVDDVVSIVPTDLLGNGTACLVWSSPLPGDARGPMRYVNLMGSRKPHLLVKTVNNLGAETRVDYAPSTKFYLQDKLDGKPWITRLPFPVHVVERVETYDHISHNRFVTRYAYHHGYFDGEEREFRGFGMVEQFDTEEFAALSAGGDFPIGDNVDATSHVPPVHTKTWFHTGVYLGRDNVSNFFAGLRDAQDKGQYYREPGLTNQEAANLGLDDEARQLYDDARAKERLLDDTVLPDGLALEEEREACRALKGSMLRQEVYALDGTDKEKHPYTVTEQNFNIRTLQPRGRNRHAVFYTHARESISYHYERNPADPRVGHALTLEVDNFGNVLKSAAIGYGRRQPNPNLSTADQLRQGQVHITCTENRVTTDHDTGREVIDQRDDYRTPLPCESRTYELTGKTVPAGRNRFSFNDIFDAVSTASAIDYEISVTVARTEKRLIEHLRTYYRSNDLTGALPFGHMQSMALPFESYKLAFTPGLAKQIFVDSGKLSQADLDSVLANDAQYAHTESDTNWWIPSGKIFYDPLNNVGQELDYARRHFFLPHRYRNPFHTNAVSTESFVTYDGYDLLVHETLDALGNRVTVGERRWVLADGTVLPERRRNDYRVLQPELIMDPNRNCSEVRFDALGMVVGTAAMGKPEESPRPGDRITASFHADLTQAEIDQFLADPKGAMAATLLSAATSRIVYDLTAYSREPDLAKKLPAVAATLARETHVSDLVVGEQTKIQVSLSYSDGFGREIQKKIQAENGRVPQRDSEGRIIVGPDNQPVLSTGDQLRWVGSGWTVFNNKGKPVRQYEPFFTDTYRFEFDVRIGVSPVLFYDPVERVVATLHPNHTWEKVVFDPWRRKTWDVNDTLVIDPQLDPDLNRFLLQPDGSQRLPVVEYEPSWYALRTDVAHDAVFVARYPDATDRTNETRAAEKTRVHAATPTVAHADSLGRTFLTVAHNKFKYSNTPPVDPPVEEFYTTRIVLDIEGNQREVIDAKDRAVMHYDYDMLGNRVHQASMEAGERWMLNDVAGKPLYAWDSRNHRVRTAYDKLRRPTESFLSEAGSSEKLVSRSNYGESRLNPEASNLRGKMVELRDQAGILTSDLYDFKGNLRRSRRQLAEMVGPAASQIPAYKTTVDWNGAVQLGVETYASRTRYDALNRPTQVIVPHSDQTGATVNVIQPGYNDANLLEKVDAWLNRNTEPGNFLDPATADLHAVTNIDYDAKGQRAEIHYGNDATTTYAYDPLTFRLSHLQTTRASDNATLQDLHYAYDPAGNITHIRDAAQQTIYFKNQVVGPHNDYNYDAIYRLIESTGREHLGQIGGTPIPHSYNDAPRVGIVTADAVGRFAPNDVGTMGRYIERYHYDAVGNFIEMKHLGSNPANPGWTRGYNYNEASLLESGKQSNRLSGTQVGNGTTAVLETYPYDAHGNMLRMLHLQIMQWDFKDQLQMTQRQAVNPADADGVARDGERTWYVYDSTGQRVRKVTELAGGQLKYERMYLGGFEIYRKNGRNPLVRETLHIMDDKQRVALVENRTQGNDSGPQQLFRYQFGNHLGSASLELDEQAKIISYEEYAPYGSTTYQAVRNKMETAKRYRYTAKERDEESGLYYHGARYYAAWLCRWTSADPLDVRAGHQNLYEFVRSNPVLFHDPNGKEEEEDILSEVVKGDFHEGKTTWSGTLLNIGVGVIPFVGQAADARDTVAAGVHLWEKPSWGNAGMLGLAVVGWVPLIGDAIKGSLKVGRKVAKEAVKEGVEKVEKELVEKTTKEGIEKTEKAATEKAAKESADQADDAALDKTFKGGKDEGAFDTAERLKRGNFGEKVATEYLGTKGHKVLNYKPSILGTNQGGIDMVTIKDGIVHFIDNKALTRSGNVSSVSALTTNFAKNKDAVLKALKDDLAKAVTKEQKDVLQSGITAIEKGNFKRVVTNANLTKDDKILSGVSDALKNQGFEFIDVFKP